MLHPILRTVGCVAIILLLALPRAMADDDFTVSGVHEDITAANALAARDQALAEGREQAFDMLMARLAPGAPPPHLSSDQLTDLVASFEVANEKSSDVRYVVDYTFHFKPASVRQLLNQLGTSYVTPAQPVVVLPVYEAGGQKVLWDDPNPWRDAWANHAGNNAPLSAVVPVGGLADVSLIDVPKALAGDRQAIAAMSARHDHDDVVVALAQQKSNPTRINITTTRYPGNGAGAPQTMTLVVTQHPNETLSDFFTRAAGYTMLRLAQTWQSTNAVSSNETGTLEVQVPVTSLSDWVAIRKRLSQVGLIHSVDLVSFSANEVEATLHYVGNKTQLGTALAAAGLGLAGSDPDWTLSARTAGPAPASAMPAPEGVAQPSPPSSPSLPPSPAAPGTPLPAPGGAMPAAPSTGGTGAATTGGSGNGEGQP
ncbi:MAG: DUF2066 domain-containing protein [Stellaceae bacterium]